MDYSRSGTDVLELVQANEKMQIGIIITGKWSTTHIPLEYLILSLTQYFQDKFGKNIQYCIILYFLYSNF